MTITPAQVRAARAMLKMVQDDLAKKAGLSQRSLAVIETGAAKPRAATIERIREALETEGIVFMETEVGRGVILKNDHPDV